MKNLIVMFVVLIGLSPVLISLSGCNQTLAYETQTQESQITSAENFFDVQMEYIEENSTELTDKQLEELLTAPGEWTSDDNASKPSVSVADSDNLPQLKDKRPYTVVSLPDYMDDLWVPYLEKKVIVYKDTRNNMYGIADEKGNVLIEAQCPYIIDQRHRGTWQNTSGISNELLCTDDKYNYTEFGCINLKTNSIDSKNCIGFPPRGYNITLDIKDGMGLVQNSVETDKPKYGYIDKNHNVVIDFQYDIATNFESGYALVQKSGKWLIIEKDGSHTFDSGAWKLITHLRGQIFIGQAKNGKWYRFELPVSNRQPKIAIPANCVLIGTNDHGDSVIVIDSKSCTRKVVNTTSSGVKVDTCSMMTYLKKGDMIHVKDDLDYGLRIRKTPNGEPTGKQAFSKNEKGPIYFQITGGPKCEDNKVWYEVNFLGHKGWIAEGADGQYYLEKRK